MASRGTAWVWKDWTISVGRSQAADLRGGAVEGHLPGQDRATGTAEVGARRGAVGLRRVRTVRVDAGFPGRSSTGRGRRGGPLTGQTDPARRGRAPAPHPVLDAIEGPGLRPKRTRIIGLYTHPPDDATVICADELGPVIPRTFPPAPTWSPDGHRIKAELDYSRGPEKTWSTAVCDRPTARPSP
jgi:hypothetical protein